MKPYIVILISICLHACSVNYSFTGASISPQVKTFSVQYIENQAATKHPDLSNIITEGLKEKFRTSAGLSLVNSQGDLQLEGTIIEYATNYLGVTAQQQAASNRLTISITIQFTNSQEEGKNFEKKYSRYYDFDAMVSLSTIETAAIKEITEQIIEDVFMDSVAQW